MPIDETIFDNEYSLLYKVAEDRNVPAKYILLGRNLPKNFFGANTYVSEALDLQLIDLENWIINHNSSLSELLQIFPTQNAPLITIKDFVFFWAEEYEGDPFEEIETIGHLCFGIECKETYLEYKTKIEYETDQKNWKKQYNLDNNNRHKIFQQITVLQQQLAQLKSRDLSTPTFELVTISTSLNLYGTPVSINDGIDLFALLQASPDVPFIEYRDNNGKSYYKLYEPLFKDPPTSLSSSIAHIGTAEKNNIMYFVTLIDKSSERARGLHYDYQVYRLDRNELLVTINLLDMDRTTLLNRIIQAFSNSNITFSALTDKNLGGTFVIPDVLIDEYVFMHLVTNDNLFMSYFNLNERNKTAADQTNHLIYYRTLNIPSLEEKKEGEAPAESIRESIENRMHFRFIQEGTSTQIRFTKVPSDKILNRFQTIFARLMSLYLDQYDTIYEIYDYLIPDLYKVAEEEGYNTKRRIKGAAGAPLIHGGDVKLTDLKEDVELANLIIPGFSRQCQQKQLAMRLPENLLPPNPPRDELFDYTFTIPIQGKRTKFEDRQILPFPKDEAKFYFFCPSDEYPYPGVQHNSLKNSDIYPYTPCCFKDDQSIKNMGYAEYYLNKETLKKTILPTVSRKNISHKIAKLPKTLETYLSSYSTKSNEFVRYGVQTSPNSFIHAVLTAKNIKEYSDLQSDEEREEYVRTVRKNLLDTVNIAVFRQELYDRSSVQIQNDIENLESYFDPRLYIRGLEELYNVNIYLLTGDINDINSGNFVIPRHKVVYVKPYRPNRQSIILFMTQVRNDDPQCNLVIAQPQTIKAKTGTRLILTIRLFSESMTRLLHNGLAETYTQYTSTFPLLERNKDKSIILAQPNQLDMYRNIYYFLDYLSLNITPKAQILDAYGKSRGLIINTEAGDMTIFTLPSQPENLPDFFTTNATPIPLARSDLAINLFGNPIAVSVSQDKEENIIGLWYAFGDILQALYVPIEPTPKTKFSNAPVISNINYPPTMPITNDSIDNYLNTKWTASILIQVINWLYNLSNETITNFIKKYTKIERMPVFNLRAVKRKLPNNYSLQQALNYLEEGVPNLVKNGKILIDNEKLQNNIAGRLKTMQGYPKPIEDNYWTLFNYYNNIGDFPHYPHNNIFIERRNFQAWVVSINRTQGVLPILSTLSNDIIVTLVPILYQNSKDGKIYIIQTFTGYDEEDEKRQALACIRNWSDLRVNTGPTTEPLTDKILPPHVIYQLQAVGSIIATDDQSKGKTPYYQVLLLKPSPEIKRYVALLPLL